MQKANLTLLSVRISQWDYQYWLLIISMIIMYPTPALDTLESDQLQLYSTQIREWIFWIFWCGIYKTPENLTNIGSSLPLYVMLILLIFEKQAQKWQINRFGCSIEKIRYFTKIDELMRQVQEKLHPGQINAHSEFKPVVPRNEKCVTFGEAR